jgi:hypothetical protein
VQRSLVSQIQEIVAVQILAQAQPQEPSIQLLINQFAPTQTVSISSITLAAARFPLALLTISNFVMVATMGNSLMTMLMSSMGHSQPGNAPGHKSLITGPFFPGISFQQRSRLNFWRQWRANNTFNDYVVYKDNGRVLYTVDGFECRTLYRCF